MAGPAGGFAFAAAGDHCRGPATARTLAALGNAGTDFYLALGDLSYGGTEAAWCDLVKSHLGSSYPFEIISGNHDQASIGRFTACLPDRMASRGGPYGERFVFDYPRQAPLARFILISPDLTLPGFAQPLYEVRSTDPEAAYFASSMGANLQPTKGFVRYEVTPTQLSGAFVASDGGGFSDRFTITR